MNKLMACVLTAALVTGLTAMPALAGESKDEPVTLTMWGWNAGDIEIIFEEYKKATGANVELNYVPVQTGEVFQKLQTNLSAGLEMPDLVPSEINQRGTMIGLDIWEDLSQEPYNFDESTIFDYYLPLCKNDRGEMVCLPRDMSTAGLAYKKDLAKEYLGTDDPAELEAMLSDWDAFKEKGLEVQEKSDGKVFMFASLTNVKQILDGQNATPVIEDGKLNLDASVRDTIEKMVDFRDNRIVDNISESSPSYSASYADDLHIFYPCAGWTPSYVIAPNDPEGKDAWGLMVPPNGCFNWGGSGHLIPKTAAHKEEAYQFASWLITKEGSIIQHDLLDYNQANKEIYEDEQYVHMENEYFGDQDLGEILFVKAVSTMNVRPVSPYDVTILDTWNLVTDTINNDPSVDTEYAMQMFEEELINKIPDLQ